MCVALWWLETTCGVHKVASVIEKDMVYSRNLPVQRHGVLQKPASSREGISVVQFSLAFITSEKIQQDKINVILVS